MDKLEIEIILKKELNSGEKSNLEFKKDLNLN